MPKLSIYVPDELWDRVRQARPELNPSQLVQAAIADIGGGAPFTSHPDSDTTDTDAFERLKEKLTAEAAHRYGAGSHSALEIVEALQFGLDELSEMAEYDWSVVQWTFQKTDADLIAHLESRDDHWSAKFLRALGYSLLPGFEVRATPFFTRGALDTLRRLWREVAGNEEAETWGPTPELAFPAESAGSKDEQD